MITKPNWPTPGYKRQLPPPPVSAIQQVADDTVNIGGNIYPIASGQWLVNDETGATVILSDSDFKRLYTTA